MSRIEGNSSDDQRAREMNEANLRAKIDAEKRTSAERQTKTFNEVMSDKVRTQEEKRESQRENEKKGGNKRPTGRDQVRDPNDKSILRERENARRAALAHAQLTGNMQQTRGKLSDAAVQNESDGARRLSRARDDETERVDKSVREDDRADARLSDEQHAPVLGQPQPQLFVQDEREQHKKRQGQGQQPDQEQHQIEALARAEGPRAAHVVEIPREMLEKIADAIQVATAANGRTEVIVSLKGTMLEGVTLKVSLKKQKVHCSFEGCDKTTRNLIESSKGELMRQLSKRGMELEILRVK